MKKLIIASILSFIVPLQAFAFYSDVPSDHQYYEEIKSLYDQGLLPEEDSFKPDAFLTKGETYKFIVKYNNTPLSKKIDLPYADLSNNDPLAAYIQTAIDHQALKAFGKSNELGPNFNAKKQFVLQTMFNSLGIGVNYFFDQTAFPFEDTSAKSFLGPIAQRAADLGIFEAETPTKFKAFKNVTHAEAAYYLYQIHQYDPADPSTIIVEKTVKGSPTKERDDLKTFLDAWDSIHNNYLYQDQIDDKELEFGAIKGFVNRLNDSYTIFEEPSEATTLLNTLTSQVEGIGILIDTIDGRITIISPIKEGPAEKAGLQAGDVIIRVDDESVNGKTLEEVAQKIRGAAGTDVKITAQRNNAILTFTVTRAAVQVQTVEGEILKSGNTRVGYISISTFSKKTFSEFKDKVAELEIQSPGGYIIDLRNNPGGYMNVAINIISLFSEKKGTAVKTRYHNGEIEAIQMADIDAPLAGKRISILVNKGSASASEIMAATLQELGIAKIIGTQTFGKGTAQELAQYNNGGLLKYTVAEWLTPQGKSINGSGVTPDQVVENTDTTMDAQLEAALRDF